MHYKSQNDSRNDDRHVGHERSSDKLSGCITQSLGHTEICSFADDLRTGQKDLSQYDYEACNDNEDHADRLHGCCQCIESCIDNIFRK